MPTGSHTGAETSPAKTYILPLAACPITSSCGSGKGGRSTHLPCARAAGVDRAKNAVRHKQDKPTRFDIRFAPSYRLIDYLRSKTHGEAKQKRSTALEVRQKSRSYHAVTSKVKVA